MPAPYRYAFRYANGQPGALLYAELRSALYTVLLDFHEQRRIPIGIKCWT